MKGLYGMLILLSAATALLHASQKPVKPHYFHLDGGIDPRTVQELWAASTIVADVTFSARGEPVDDSSMVVTRYTATIREVFKKGNSSAPLSPGEQ